MSNQPSERGFTLMELMVTIAVLAILVAIAAPSFNDFFDKYRVRGAANDVISVVSQARAEASKSGRAVEVDFGGTADTSGAWCVAASPAVVPTDGTPIGVSTGCSCAGSGGTPVGCNLIGGEVMAVAQGAHPGVKASAATVALNFSFDSRLGLVVPVANHEALLTSPTGKYSLRVAVNPLGQANLCTPSGTPVIAGVSTCS